MIEKIKKITDGKLDISDEQIAELLQSVTTKYYKNVIEREQFGYTWTFWLDENQDTVRIVEIRIADYKNMRSWYIDIRE